MQHQSLQIPMQLPDQHRRLAKPLYQASVKDAPLQCLTRFLQLLAFGARCVMLTFSWQAFCVVVSVACSCSPAQGNWCLLSVNSLPSKQFCISA